MIFFFFFVFLMARDRQAMNSVVRIAFEILHYPSHVCVRVIVLDGS